jgi:hypothetical protein
MLMIFTLFWDIIPPFDATRPQLMAVLLYKPHKEKITRHVSSSLNVYWLQFLKSSSHSTYTAHPLLFLFASIGQYPAVIDRTCVQLVKTFTALRKHTSWLLCSQKPTLGPILKHMTLEYKSITYFNTRSHSCQKRLLASSCPSVRPSARIISAATTGHFFREIWYWRLP